MLGEHLAALLRRLAALQEPARRAVDKVLDWIDERKNRLPPRARRLVRDVPTQAFLGAAVLLAFAVVGGLLAAVILIARPDPAPASSSAVIAPTSSSTGRVSSVPSSGPARVPPVPDGTEPTEAEIARARAAGSAQLQKLSARYPKHAGVALALAQAYAAEKKQREAVGAIGRVLSADPKANADPELGRILFAGAQAKASQEAAFTLLEGPMGAQGADVVYDLAVQPGVPAHVKARAERWLHSKDFDRLSSPQLNIAVALRHATTCKQRHGLLLRARNVGDERSLVYLRQFPSAAGNACLLEDKRLDDAVRAIEQRRKRN